MKSDADQIREYVWIRYIEPARHRGDATVSIKSGDVVKGLNLKNKTPNVCTALRSKISSRRLWRSIARGTRTAIRYEHHSRFYLQSDASAAV